MTRLAGRVVATTRDGTADDPLDRLLEHEGARVVTWPTLSFEGPSDPVKLRRVKEAVEAGTYAWVVFTSARSVAALGQGGGVPGMARVAAVGSATAAALAEAGWQVDVVGDGDAGALVDALAAHGGVDGARVLFPAASLAGDALEEGLSALGARVDRVEAYRTVPRPPDPDRVRADVRRGVDAVAFASPSAVGALAEALGTDWPGALADTGFAAIGPTTRRALLESGVEEARIATADPPSLDRLVDACVVCIEHVRERKT